MSSGLSFWLGILSASIVIEIIGLVKSRINRRKKRKEKEYVSLYNQVENHVKEAFCIKDQMVIPPYIEKMINEIVITINREKSESYKEGFWNGQKAKIEKLDLPEPASKYNQE